MTGLTQAAILVAAALCLLSHPACTAIQMPIFRVVGQVFCDVCRADFVSRLSKPMAGAAVKLECRNEMTDEVTYSLLGQTDDKGSYNLIVEGDRGRDTCQVLLLSSSRPDCAELPDVPGALVSLIPRNVFVEDTGNANGTDEDVLKANSTGFNTTAMAASHVEIRQVSPLSFNAKHIAPQCAELVRELEFQPEAMSEVKQGNV